MEQEEMLEQTNEAENVETETTEEITEEGINLTDTTETEKETVEEKTEVKKTLRELLEENPDYQEELTETIIKPRLARKDREYQKELSKYKDTDNVLRATLNVKEGEDVNQKLREAYEADGIELPSRYEPGLNDRDIERLGIGDAEDIIVLGNNAMKAEANRLANIGYANLNPREKATFNRLANELTSRKEKSELKRLGAPEDLLNDDRFIQFKKQFNSNASMETIYGMYQKQYTPKKDISPMGSMKDTNQKVVNEKDFYSPEDVKNLTDDDWKKPGIWEKVRASQKKWKQ